MGDVTKIQWTDYTFNPWIGCSKVHAGCLNCYAEADFDKRRHVAEWGVNGTRHVTSDANWAKPRSWNRKAEADGVRRKVFCASLADVFEDRPELEDWRSELFRLIFETPNLDWLLLTKRPENIDRMWENPYPYMNDFPYRRRNNVWLGTSVSDQSTADAMVPALLKCRDLSPVLFLSAEPLLGPIDLTHIKSSPDDGNGWTYRHWNALTGSNWCDAADVIHPNGTGPIDWVIVGGESGPNARPCFFEWIDEIVEQCKSADCACFVKQMGSNALDISAHGQDIAARFDDKKGGDPSEWPEELRVRQFPEIANVAG